VQNANINRVGLILGYEAKEAMPLASRCWGPVFLYAPSIVFLPFFADNDYMMTLILAGEDTLAVAAPGFF